MEFILLVGVLVLGTLLRVGSIMLSGSSDEAVALWHVDRQRGHIWVNYQVDDSVVAGDHGYPILVHWVLSRFPQQYEKFGGYVLNVLPDLLTGIVVYIMAEAVSVVLPSIGEGQVSFGVISCGLYMTAPILIPAKLSRMKTISGRTWGGLFVVFFLIGGYWLQGDAPLIGGLVSIVSGILAVLTSQFAFQVIVLFGVGLSVLGSLGPLTMVIGVVGTCFAAAFLRTREPILFFIHHKIWYFRNLDKGTTAARRRSLEDLFLLPFHIVTRSRLAGKLLARFPTRFPPFIALATLPELGVIAVGTALHGVPETLSRATLLGMSYDVFLVSSAVFLVVCVRPLSFLGQAERYFEYSAGFVAVITPVWIFSEFESVFAWQLVALLYLWHLSSVVGNLLVAARKGQSDSSSKKESSFVEAAEWLFENVSRGVVLAVPCKLTYNLSLIARRKGVHRNFSFFYRFIRRPREKGFRYFEEMTGGPGIRGEPSLEVFSVGHETLCSELGMTHLLVNRRYVPQLEKTWGSGLQGARVLHSNACFVVYGFDEM